MAKRAAPFDDPNGCIDPVTMKKLAETAEVGAPGQDETRVAARTKRIETQEKIGAENLKAVSDAGIPIAMGTDIGGQDLLPHGRNVEELALLVDAGMPASDALVAGTLGAARCIGLENEIGSIERGKVADLIAVEGDPLRDITAMQRVDFVMRSGQVVRGSSQTETC